MKHKVISRSITILFLLALVFGLAIALPGKQMAVQASQAKQGDAGGGSGVTAASDATLQKYDEKLQEVAKAGGEEEVTVRLVTDTRDITWPDYVKAIARAIPDEATGGVVWTARVKADYLAKLASLDVVVEARLVQATGPVPRFLPDGQIQILEPKGDISQLKNEIKSTGSADNKLAGNQVTGWWDVAYNHKSAAAWANGFTGDGVVVADIDSGVDFCNPDLMNTWKTYTTTNSSNYEYGGVSNYLDYYAGWPVAYSPVSNYFMLFDLVYNGQLTDLNTFAYGYSKFADTSTTGTGTTITFDSNVYTTTSTAYTGTVYHIGYHPDASLEAYVWDERIGVLVVDEDGDDVFESVYVDLDDDKDFSDEARTDKSSPTACWDYNLDGYSDFSGGLVYFIADGQHWPQGMDWYWDPERYPDSWGINPPDSGDLVAFMFDDPTGPAAAHGTLTASAIVGQGVIDGDPGVGERPSWKPSGSGMVQGAGKNAKIIAMGDSYMLHEDSTEASYYFSVWGVDGFGDTNDGAQISSNSYGSSETDNDEWDYRSRMITRLNTRNYDYFGRPNTYGQQHAFVFSTGNGAPGYGTNAPPSASTAIAVGASTQFGSTYWDSISGPDQIVWGDVIPFSNRGPTAVGSLAPSVTADGAFGAGDLTLNYWWDGWSAWESWGGTSRSCPVTAGNLSLVYDAFKQRTGSFPTWEQARELLMSGATDQNYDVFTQGAGTVNAETSTNIAGGLAGLQISPSNWSVGDYQGEEYLAFSKLVHPGDTDSQTFNLTNYVKDDQSYAIETGQLVALTSTEIDLDAVLASESAYSFYRPDYLFAPSDYAPDSDIPNGTVLMTAEVIQPYNEWEPQNDENNANNNNWRILWYSYKDVNSDRNLWTDTNGNGAVNASEIDSGEYIRFSYGYNAHTYHSVSVKEPLNPERWKDGIYLGLQHRTRSSLAPTTHLTLRVTFYGKAACDWLSLSKPHGTVNDLGSDTFVANVTVPEDMPYGMYECAIYLTNTENSITKKTYTENTTAIPVILNVASDADLTTDVVTFGGEEKGNTPFDNSFMSGSQDWTWRGESGDWRFFFVDQPTVPEDGTHLIVKDVWDDVAPETDFDSIILGPALDYWSYYVPETYGPYTLDELGRSAYNYLGNGAWAFGTATGSNTEYVAADLTDAGLHEVMQHTVRYEGDQFEVGFEKTLSTINGPTASDLHYLGYFTDDISFSTTLTQTSGLDVDVYGMSATGGDFDDTPIIQDPTEDDLCDFSAGGFYTYTTTLPAMVADFLAYVEVGSHDLDLFVYYDADNSGTFTCPGERIASSTNSAGTDDYVELSFPAAGNYLIAVQGYDVSGSTSTFDWYWERTDLDNTIAIRNADLVLNPTHPATFDLYNVAPLACDSLNEECNDGIMYVGFADAPHLFSIPITVDYAHLYYLPVVAK
jgi:hypothetical protein